MVYGQTVGVVPTPTGVFAISNRCPHMGGGMCYGKVGGIVDGDTPDQLTYDGEHLAVRCPWHGWEFRLDDGLPVGGFSNRRLRRYPVHVDGERVYVTVPRRRDDLPDDGSRQSTDESDASSVRQAGERSS
jgi:nitrite reductase/ring-hydroxylating ferredoxin subunit